MPLLLLLPVLLLGVVALAMLLWPLGLWQRFRHGRATRRAQPVLGAVNLWMLVLSSLLFLAGAAFANAWVAGALVHALGGLGAGLALGWLGLWLARFEATGGRLYYTANAWLVGALTLLVGLRVALGAWQAWHRLWQGVPASLPWPWLEGYASLLAMAGLLLGYHLAFAWGLRRRLRRIGGLRP